MVADGCSSPCVAAWPLARFFLPTSTTLDSCFIFCSLERLTTELPEPFRKQQWDRRSEVITWWARLAPLSVMRYEQRADFQSAMSLHWRRYGRWYGPNGIWFPGEVPGLGGNACAMGRRRRRSSRSPSHETSEVPCSRTRPRQAPADSEWLLHLPKSKGQGAHGHAPCSMLSGRSVMRHIRSAFVGRP